MHDIDTIQRRNIEASQAVARDQYALLIYQGLNLFKVEGVGADRNVAMDKLSERRAGLGLGERILLRPPLHPVRDQSEDRNVTVVARTEAELLAWARQ